jgi:hypothetical protein
MEANDHPLDQPVSPPPQLPNPPQTAWLPRGARAKPLDGDAESAFIRDIDEGLQHIERFHARRVMYGYSTFDEIATDIIELFDDVWLSSTRKYREPIAAAR